MTDRQPHCTVTYGGGAPKDAPWGVVWLPKGYGPTPGDRMVCYVVQPPAEDWSGYGLGSRAPLPPLVQAVVDGIEKYMAEHPNDIIGKPDNPALAHMDGFHP